MINRLPLQSLVDTAPHRDNVWSGNANDLGFQTEIETEDLYIWPDCITDEDVVDVSVVLLHSPGAMGKSSAAKAIATSLRAPLVDLAGVRVGAHSCTGLLLNNLGTGQFAQFISELQRGTTALILDGLDEAQLLAGRDNFISFLEDVAQLVSSATRSRQVVALGRREAIETAYLALLEANVKVAMGTIAPFDYPQACDFLDRTLDEHRPPVQHRVQRVPFETARDAEFGSIAGALGSEGNSPSEYWEQTSDFLGYPPVLAVLAEQLAEQSNWSRAIRPGAPDVVTNVRASAERGELLRTVIEGILEREAGKVRAQLGRALQLSPEDSGVLYMPEEQMLRVLSLTSGIEVHVQHPQRIPEAKRQQYEDQLSEFVSSHPFVRDNEVQNAVFRDYLNAFCVTTETLEAHGVSHGQVLSGKPMGPFFGYFVHALTTSSNGERVGRADEALVDALIRSNVAASVGRPHAFYGHPEDGDATLNLYDVYGEPRDRKPPLMFKVTNPTGVLELSTPVQGVTIFTAYGVRLNSRSETIELGPDLLVSANDVELTGDHLVANGRSTGDNSIGSVGAAIFVENKITHDFGLKITGYGDMALTVSIPDGSHQWRPYQLPEFGEFRPAASRVARETLYGLRRLLMAFHKGKTDGLSVYWERLERITIGDNEVLMATLRGLQELQIVGRSGDMYVLNLESLSNYKVHWNLLKSSTWSHGCRDLHKALCDTVSVSKLMKP